ncbi:hypothetical protein AAIH46_00030 [Rhizobium sp. 0TCS1.26]|uniref:hypothetical protein n=1 Tax=Rhizobium sp. 0TCS1.26 TaxID=3142623 RepID=UPI003D27AFBE
MPATSRQTRLSRPSLLLLATALAALSLSGCSSLLARSAKGPEANEAASADIALAQDVKPQKQDTARAVMAAAGKPQKAPGYVDPMVASSAGGAATAPTRHPARSTSQQGATVASANPVAAAAGSAPGPTDLGEAIHQPTGVQANQNSIFALANAQVAEANGVPAYAPVRNINPMSGSMFSARQTAEASPAAAPSAANPAGKPEDGLW